METSSPLLGLHHDVGTREVSVPHACTALPPQDKAATDPVQEHQADLMRALINRIMYHTTSWRSARYSTKQQQQCRQKGQSGGIYRHGEEVRGDPHSNSHQERAGEEATQWQNGCQEVSHFGSRYKTDDKAIFDYLKFSTQRKLGVG